MACMAGFSLPPTSRFASSFTLLVPPPALPFHHSISQYFWEKLPKDKEQGVLICLITRSPAEYMGGIGEGAIKRSVET